MTHELEAAQRDARHHNLIVHVQSLESTLKRERAAAQIVRYSLFVSRIVRQNIKLTE